MGCAYDHSNLGLTLGFARFHLNSIKNGIAVNPKTINGIDDGRSDWIRTSDPYPPRIEPSRKPAYFLAFPFRFVRVRSRSIQVNHGPIMGHGRRLSGRVAG